MSFQFPYHQFDVPLRYHQHNYSRILPITPKPIPLLPPSRKRCTISVDDGETVSVTGEMQLEDDKSDVVSGSLRYCEKALDIEKIKLLVPPPFHPLVDDTLSRITPKQYMESVCEIIIEWII